MTLLLMIALLSYFAMNTESHQLILDISRVPQNPISMVLIKESTDITIKFGIAFLEEVRLLKETCRMNASQREALFEQQVKELSQYQEQSKHVLDSEINTMTEEQKNQIRQSFRHAMKKLFAEQEKQEKELKDNCTRQYQNIVNSNMAKTLDYVEFTFNGQLTEIRQFLNHVKGYKHHLQTALDDCIDVYAPMFIGRRGSSISGSTSEVCMVFEVEGLISFIERFIDQVTNLYGINNTSVSPTQTVSSTDIDATPIVTNVLSKTVTPTGLPSSVGNHSKNQHGNRPHHHGNHGHHPHHNGHKPHHPGRHPHHHGNHHHHKSKDHDYKTVSSPHMSSTTCTGTRETNRPHPSLINDDGTVDLIQATPHRIAINTPPIDPGSHPLSHIWSRTLTVVVVCSAVSAVLILAILTVGLTLLIMRCRSPRDKGWSHLSEEQKITQMKESGYINPTYQFFDKVTQ